MALRKISDFPLLQVLDSTAVTIIAQNGATYRYPIASLLSQVGDDSITTVKIVNSSVTESKLADNAVTTPKIADSACTTSKIAESAITVSKIASNNVTADKLAANAVAASKYDQDALRKIEEYGVDSGSVNAFVVNNAIARTALNEGMLQCFKALFTNSGAATLDVDGLTAKPVYNDAAALTGGEILAGEIVTVRYDGANWQLQ